MRRRSDSVRSWDFRRRSGQYGGCTGKGPVRRGSSRARSASGGGMKRGYGGSTRPTRNTRFPARGRKGKRRRDFLSLCECPVFLALAHLFCQERFARCRWPVPTGSFVTCGRGGIGRRAALRSLWGNPWKFESSRPHHHPSPTSANDQTGCRFSDRIWFAGAVAVPGRPRVSLQSKGNRLFRSVAATWRRKLTETSPIVHPVGASSRRPRGTKPAGLHF